MRKNIVLVDFENVQPKSLSRLVDKPVDVIVFVGASQPKIPFELVDAMQRMGDRARWVRIAGTGPNALDFHIAYYIGRLAAERPGARFHIISKDKGFDPLVRHLAEQGVSASRRATVDSIAPAQTAMPQSSAIGATVASADPAKPKPAPKQQRTIQFVKMLNQPKVGKPRTVKTLSSQIATHFGNKLSAAEVAAVVADMRAGGVITVTGDKVAYRT